MAGITLIGYRGCGKSTVAALLADRTGLPWLDADAELERRVGSSIADLVRGRGEPAFRDEESRVLADVLAGEPCILATGGGVVLRSDNRGLLRRLGRPVVWLTAPVAVVRQRLAADPATVSRRPGLTGADPLAEVADAISVREPLYRECADAVFDTAADSPAEVAAKILEWRSGWAGETRP